MPKKMSIYEQEVAQGLKKRHIQFQQEFRFDENKPQRRWRFDFVLRPVKVKIAVEIEGGIFMGKGHTGGKHFEGDCEKYNQAALQGWLVLRYTPQIIPKLWEDLKTLKAIK